jgi:hypothetical protein
VAVNQPNKNRVQEPLNQLCQEVRRFISESSLGSERQQQQFEKLALQAFRFQFEHNFPYRRFCESRDKTPASLGSFRDIPAIPASAFKDLELTVLSEQDRVKTFHSSGTTTHKPGRHFHSKETLALYEQSLIKWFKSFVLPDFEFMPILILTPPPSDASHSSLVHMFETVRERFGSERSTFAGFVDRDGAWQIDFEKVQKALLHGMEIDQPLLVCGTAFSFVHLCDFLAEKKLQLPKSSRVFETGGYKGRSRSLPKEELHALITDRLSVSESFIISEYGMSELSSQAYDRRAGQSGSRTFRFPPWVRTEIVSPETGNPVETGQRGLIRIFDLANLASVMAIQTEDLAVKSPGGFDLLGRAALAEVRGCSLMHL